MPTTLKVPPIHPQGKDVALFLDNGTFYAKSPLVCATIASTAAATAASVALFTAPANTFIDDVIVVTTTAFAATSCIGGTSGVWIGLPSSSACFFEACGTGVSVVGSRSMKRSTQACSIYAGGYVTSATMDIIAIFSAALASKVAAGEFYAICRYRPANELFMKTI